MTNILKTQIFRGFSTCQLIRRGFTGTGMGLFPRFINKSARGARKSMKNMMDLDGVQFIFTGHHGYTNDYSAAVRGWRR